MTALALALFLQGPTPAPACVPDGCFMVQVRDSNGAAVGGIQVVLEVGTVIGRAVSTETGMARVCLSGVPLGQTANLTVTPAPYRLQFPSNGRVGLVCEAPSLWVCKEPDCGVLSAGQVAKIIASLQPQNQGLTIEQIERLFRDLSADALKQPDTKPLSDELLRRQMLLTAVSRAEPFLSRWEERSKEVLVRFERHALTAASHPSRKPFEEMNKAFEQYNPVFQQLQDDGDTFVREVATQWQPEISAGVRDLVAEARAIHQSELYPLNELKTSINDCAMKLPKCPGKTALLKRVAETSTLVRQRSLPALDRYAAHLTSWKETVRTRVYQGDKP